MQPKLYILSSQKNKCWLNYITAEFIRINKAEFDIIVSDVDSIHDPNDKNILYHLETYNSENSIPDKSNIVPCGVIDWLSKDLFIIKGTQEKAWTGICDYDLLWNAFVFLSRIEEYQAEKNGKNINSYCSKHPRKDKSTFDIPVVNYLFNKLESIIKKQYPELGFGNTEPPVIEFSHDVDYISKTVQVRIKQTLFNSYKTIKFVLRPKLFFKQLSDTIRFLISSPSYWCFDFWETLEKEYNIRSVFYVYAGTGKKKFKAWLLDPSYDLNNKKLINKLKQLIKDGFEIGLHGSYDSATDGNKLAEEKQLLETKIDQNIIKIRQHWLRYNEQITPRIHNEYFRYDSSLGWNDRAGFRSGCSSRYRAYNHEQQEPYSYMITPQIIMDSNIFEYGADDAEKSFEKAFNLMCCMERVKSATVSISWHQRVCSMDYNWHHAYKKIIKQASEIKQYQ